MQFINNYSSSAFLDTSFCFLVAFVLGTLIGAERQYRQRAAGLRTNVFVAVGAAAFVDLGHRIAGNAESVRVISYVVSGIGFLGAGVIMKEGMNVRGLNTAATLWCSAAVGAMAGSDLPAEAALLTGFVIVGNTILRFLVHAIDRVPISARLNEETFELRLVVDKAVATEMRERIKDLLEMAQYQIHDVECMDLSDGKIALIFKGGSASIHKTEIATVMKILERRPDIVHAHFVDSSRE